MEEGLWQSTHSDECFGASGGGCWGFCCGALLGRDFTQDEEGSFATGCGGAGAGGSGASRAGPLCWGWGPAAFMRDISPSSSISGTPISIAFEYLLLPQLTPTRRKLVFLEMEPVTRPPWRRMRSSASSRLRLSRTPEITKVRPVRQSGWLKGISLEPAFSGWSLGRCPQVEPADMMEYLTDSFAGSCLMAAATASHAALLSPDSSGPELPFAVPFLAGVRLGVAAAAAAASFAATGVSFLGAAAAAGVGGRLRWPRLEAGVGRISTSLPLSTTFSPFRCLFFPEPAALPSLSWISMSLSESDRTALRFVFPRTCESRGCFSLHGSWRAMARAWQGMRGRGP
mmetsp:Transcript_23724/g.65840  ORF Transcript_23724/g.65840 Transcript_23724/m.65840 type:complete len:342 (+) Transcript_23724:1624-2649(+)